MVVSWFVHPNALLEYSLYFGIRDSTAEVSWGKIAATGLGAGSFYTRLVPALILDHLASVLWLA